jgi:Tat protein translocase TatC
VTDESKMSFIEHLEELRRRLITCVAAVFVSMIFCWFFREQILSFLLAPLYTAWSQVDGLPPPKPLNFSSMLEPFVAYLKLSALGGVFVAAPVILLQIWRFVAPGLYTRERRLAIPFVVVSTILFVGGSLMAYSVVFPIGFRFFLDFAAGQEMNTYVAAVELDVTQAGNEEVETSHFEPRHVVVLDGGVDAGLDAGYPIEDTDSEKVSAKTKRVSPIVLAEENAKEFSESEQWYSSLMGRLLEDDCAAFSVVAAQEEVGTKLRLIWHAARCAALPELIKVKRDGIPVSVEWTERTASEVGFVEYVARDRRAAAGAHTYELKLPANPGGQRLAPVLMVKDYLSFAIRLLLAFGLVFELPILISFLSFAGIVNYKQLLGFSRWFFVIAVIIGAMLTPPDVVTQLLLAVPLMVLYFISVLVAYLFGPKPD